MRQQVELLLAARQVAEHRPVLIQVAVQVADVTDHIQQEVRMLVLVAAVPGDIQEMEARAVALARARPTALIP
jgi:hypothetical protein